MELSRGVGRMTNVDVLKCEDLSASCSVNLRNKIKRLMERRHFRFIVDLREARKMDVARLGILVERLIRMRKHKGDIRLCSLRPEITRMMERVGVSSLFETFTTKEEALKSFRDM